MRAWAEEWEALTSRAGWTRHLIDDLHKWYNAQAKARYHTTPHSAHLTTLIIRCQDVQE